MIELIVDEQVSEPLPDERAIQHAVEAACREAGLKHAPYSLCIRFSDDQNVAALNLKWRKKQGVTDVLSFSMQESPMQQPSTIDPHESLGDIILATPFTIKEAARLSLPATDHMLHLIIHATLHLLGHDHTDEDDTDIMQTYEKAAMQQLGLHNPYPDHV